MIKRMIFMLLLCVVLIPVRTNSMLSAPETESYLFLQSWGNDGDVQFDAPYDIAVDGSDNVYVVERYNHRVQKFTADGSFLLQWNGSKGNGGKLIQPCGIAVDGQGIVYVADSGRHQVQVFSADNGEFRDTWDGSDCDGGPLGFFYGIAVGSGSVYVADTDNTRIVKFAWDGTCDAEWDLAGGLLHHIAVDSSENVYVVDFGSERILKLDSNGGSVAQWETGPVEPFGITVDENDNVYVTGDAHVMKFTSEGELVTEWGEMGNREGQFNKIRGLVIDKMGNVYVTDSENRRIQKFATEHPTPDPVYGLTLNGSFEEDPALIRWTFGGELPVWRSGGAIDGSLMAQLGTKAPPTEQGQGKAWLYQTMYIRPEWVRPRLAFYYRMFVNDITDYSDFYVYLSNSNGETLSEINRDGFRPCHDNLPPPPNYGLGWRRASYDLSDFKGQTVRLRFENRNLWPNSLGIWTYVDNVRVIDAGPLPEPPGPYRVYLPVIMNTYSICDPIVDGLRDKSIAHRERP